MCRKEALLCAASGEIGQEMENKLDHEDDTLHYLLVLSSLLAVNTGAQHTLTLTGNASQGSHER